MTVLRDGETLVKAVAGCNGYNAPKLRRLIEQSSGVCKETVYNMAREVRFGCDDCLVVMDENGSVGADVSGYPRYRDTFWEPRFNPRWWRGTSTYLELVDEPERRTEGDE